MHSTPLSSSSLILSSAWYSLLLNPSTVLQLNYCIVQLYDFCFILFNIFYLFVKSSLCSDIVFLTSVSIFTIILSSLLGNSLTCFIKISFWTFILFFYLEHNPCSFIFLNYLCLFLWITTATSASLDRLVSCRRWTMPISPAQVPGFFSTFCDCPSHHLCSL